MGKADIPLIFKCAMLGTSCIKVDGDGGGRVTFSVDEEDSESLKELIDRRNIGLWVTVEVEDAPSVNFRFEATIMGTSCIKVNGDVGGSVTMMVTDKYKQALKELIDHRMIGLVVTVEPGPA